MSVVDCSVVPANRRGLVSAPTASQDEWRNGPVDSPHVRAPMNAEGYRWRADRFREMGDVERAKAFDQYAKMAEAEEERAREKERARHVGANPYVATNAALFMAVCLRQKRMPRGAERWMAQHALEEWLPHLPAIELPPILDVLSGCTERQLGRPLARLVQRMGAA